MVTYTTDAVQRRLGTPDSRGPVAEYSRGANIYNGGSSRSQPYASGSFGQNIAPTERISSQNSQQQQPYTWGYNPMYEQRMNQLMSQRSQLGSGRELGERRLGEQYTFGADAMKRALDQNLENNTINMADQGILRSGINTRQQGRIGEDYQRNMSQMASDVARQREDMNRQYAQQEQQIQDQMRMLEMDRARQEAEDRRAWEMQQAQTAAYQQMLQQMQPVMDSAGRYHSPDWSRITNTPYPSAVSHQEDSAISRALYR